MVEDKKKFIEAIIILIIAFFTIYYEDFTDKTIEDEVIQNRNTEEVIKISDGDKLNVYYLDVGQADSILIENNNNQFGENNNDSSVENDELTSYTHNLFVPSKVEKEINNTELGKNVTIDEIFFNPNHNSYSKYKDAYFYGKNMIYI